MGVFNRSEENTENLMPKPTQTNRIKKTVNFAPDVPEEQSRPYQPKRIIASKLSRQKKAG